MIDAVELTQQLVRIDTRNPPGGETECVDFLEPLLRGAGLEVERHNFGDGRWNIVARRRGRGVPVMFTGHIDTVPLGSAPWTRDPFGGEIDNGLLYGRGACDMKAGVAAMIAATVADRSADPVAVTLVITGGEETGSHGAQALVDGNQLEPARLLVVCEPTDNRFLVGHKGALWLKGLSTGVTAHGSTPHLGDNALLKAAAAALRVADFGFNVKPHPIMGSPTVNVGTMHAGLNVNSVPDRATFTVDIRTIPGIDHGHLHEHIAGTAGEDVAFETLVDLPPVWSDPEGPEIAAAAGAYETATRRGAEAVTANYFTDASVLKPALGDVPTVVCGPGDPAMAHKTDEYCAVASITEAQAIYAAIIDAASR